MLQFAAETLSLIVTAFALALVVSGMWWRHRLRTARARFAAEADRLAGLVATSTDRSTTQERELRTVTAARDQAATTASMLTDEAVRLRTTTSELHSLLDDATSRGERHERRSAELAAQLAEIDATRSALTAQVEAAAQEQHRLESSLEAAVHDAEGIRVALASLQQTRAHEQAVWATEHGRTSEELTQLRERHADTLASLDETVGVLEGVRSQRDELARRHDDLSSELAAARRRIDQVDGELAMAHERSDTLAAQLAAAVDRGASLASSLSAADASGRELSFALDAAVGRLVSADGEVLRLRDAAAVAERASQERNAALLAELAGERERLGGLAADLARVTEDRDRLHGVLSGLRREHDELVGRLRTARALAVDSARMADAVKRRASEQHDAAQRARLEAQAQHAAAVAALDQRLAAAAADAASVRRHAAALVRVARPGADGGARPAGAVAIDAAAAERVAGPLRRQVGLLHLEIDGLRTALLDAARRAETAAAVERRLVDVVAASTWQQTTRRSGPLGPADVVGRSEEFGTSGMEHGPGAQGVADDQDRAPASVQPSPEERIAMLEAELRRAEVAEASSASAAARSGDATATARERALGASTRARALADLGVISAAMSARRAARAAVLGTAATASSATALARSSAAAAAALGSLADTHHAAISDVEERIRALGVESDAERARRDAADAQRVAAIHATTGRLSRIEAARSDLLAERDRLAGSLDAARSATAAAERTLGDVERSRAGLTDELALVGRLGVEARAAAEALTTALDRAGERLRRLEQARAEVLADRDRLAERLDRQSRAAAVRVPPAASAPRTDPGGAPTPAGDRVARAGADHQGDPSGEDRVEVVIDMTAPDAHGRPPGRATATTVPEASSERLEAAELGAARRLAGAGTPVRPDDLERVPGIGPILARTLHRLGVHTYRQIGEWTPEDVDRIQALLPEYPGRIERDGWVIGARTCWSMAYGLPWTDRAAVADAPVAGWGLRLEQEGPLTIVVPTHPPIAAHVHEPSRVSSRIGGGDDLQRVVGIGPRIESALRGSGITSYVRLQAATVPQLRAALASAGLTWAPSLSTWAAQASYLAAGDQEGLADYLEASSLLDRAST